MESKYIELLNERIHYIEENTGKPKVLFLHGFNSSAAFANQVYLQKNRNYDVVAIDFPGCGFSSAKEAITIELYQQVALEFVKQYNYDFKLVIGHSLGGASALYLLNNNLVKKALLAAPINYEILDNKLGESVEAAIKRMKSWLIPENYDSAYESSDNLIYNDKLDYRKNLSKVATMFLKLMDRKRPMFLNMVTSQILNPNYLKTSIKSLYQANNDYEFITGINDKFIPYFTIKNIANKMQKNVTLLQNCGHALFFEQPEAINKKINQLVEYLYIKG
ncbi:alpha/beta fold hydrolase [Mycoplasma sp. 4423]